MPVQVQQNASFAKRLGVRVAQANAEHKDKPVDLGNRRLPAGIRNGIAKLSTMYTKLQTEDDGMTPKGETFFRASAIVMDPKEHNGEKVEGMVTQVMIPLCDVPAKGQRKASTFNEQWYKFQNVFKLLGIPPCPETPATDPTGIRTEAYFFSAMKILTDPGRPPVYITFSTRGWTPPPSPQQPKPEEMVFETWHGLANEEDVKQASQFNAAAGVKEVPPSHSLPPTPLPNGPYSGPPTIAADGLPPGPLSSGPLPSPDSPPPDPADEVAMLAEVAMNDPEGATEEGAAASARLEELAWAAGWTKDQTASAPDWAGVAEMALNPPVQNSPSTPTLTSKAISEPVAEVPPPNDTPVVVVGSRWKFAKRTKEGAKLKNSKGEEFPPQEVEVVSVDSAAKTCTLKTVRDGKDVVDIRTKVPVLVKWEWLE